MIRRRYQFWFFAYDSSNPIAYSALQLRRLLTSAVARLDPERKDPALSRMVLIGHPAIDNMSPRNPFLRALSGIPLAPGVHAHSIISVETTGPVADGDDGVVAYSSAHIEGVESELVVHSPHSTQAKPATIEEVRRILRLHLATP